MTETRAQTLAELRAQLDEIRLTHNQQSEANARLFETQQLQAEEQAQHHASLQRDFAGLREAIAEIALKLVPPPPPSPQSNTPNSSTNPLPPDPPDNRRPTPPTTPNTTPHNNPAFPGGLASCIAKVEFPRFDGGVLLREWISRCEQFFALDNTAPEMKVRLASLHLEGKALQWHHNYIRNRFDIIPSWSEYIIDVSTRFGKPFDDPLADLVTLKQTESIDGYLDKFECALTRMNLPATHALSIFLANMTPHLQFHVRQFNPTTLGEAARLAKLHESSLQSIPNTKSNRSSSTPFTPFQRFNKYVPLLPTLDVSKTTPKSPSPITALPPDKPIRRISPEEMQDRRNKGLCWFCDEQYTPGHHLKHKKSQIYFLECDDDIDTPDAPLENPDSVAEEFPPEAVEQLHISLNALSGSTHFNCMRVVGQVGKTKLHILIDPGSTHNFLNLDVAKLLGCKLEDVKPLLVAAVGHKLSSGYKCSEFSWRVQGYDFCTEVRTLPLDCCDLVLGIQWLTTIGPVWWDFVKMRMEFVFRGTKRVLRGVQPGCKVINSSSLNKLLHNNPQLALLQLCDPASDDAQFCHISTSGKENVAADALSRVTGSQLLSLTLSQAHTGFFDSIAALWKSDPALQKIISDLQIDSSSHPQFTFVNQELRRHGKLVVGQDPSVKLHIFQWLHDSAIGGHSGRDATLQRIKSIFYWKGMNTEVQNYVRNCTTCQRNKYDLSTKPGLLQPLPIPEGIWQSISLDFIEGLPPSYNRHCILVVVDRLTYKLQLPPSATIHNVFHVSQLKRCYLLDIGTSKEPEAILERKMENRQGAAATKVLVQWKGQSMEDATWELYSDFAAKYPTFDP
ncbi:hypothetical protein V2J09_016690 [Rumex salicifolius]